jgi:hypothetical protein
MKGKWLWKPEKKAVMYRVRAWREGISKEEMGLGKLVRRVRRKVRWSSVTW